VRQNENKPSIFDVPRASNEGKEKPQGFIESYRVAAVATTIPFALLAGPLFGYFLGLLLDKKFGTSYLASLISILGLLASVNLTYRLIRRITKM